ncbi:MAG: hypothetical protein L0196_00670 [candidate division Zixibacteria bacterium]|nr:hypothetical protein [candidate division Zixibacteria bacterium]
MTKEYLARKKLLYKLCVAKSDITSAMTACKYLISSVKNTDDPLYLPLLNAIIVCYSRPFTNNKPLGSLPRKWHKFGGQKHRTIHGTLLTFRHKIIAHSDLKYRPVFIYPPGTLPSIAGAITAGLKITVVDKRLPLYFFPEILKMCLNLVNRLDIEIQKQVQSLFDIQSLSAKKFELIF